MKETMSHIFGHVESEQKSKKEKRYEKLQNGDCFLQKQAVDYSDFQ